MNEEMKELTLEKVIRQRRAGAENMHLFRNPGKGIPGASDKRFFAPWQYFHDGGNQEAGLTFAQFNSGDGHQEAICTLSQSKSGDGGQDAFIALVQNSSGDDSAQLAAFALSQSKSGSGVQGAGYALVQHSSGEGIQVGICTAAQYSSGECDQIAAFALGQYQSGIGKQGALFTPLQISSSEDVESIGLALGQFATKAKLQRNSLLSVAGSVGEQTRSGVSLAGVAHKQSGLVNLAYRAENQSGKVNVSWKKPHWTRGLSLSRKGISLNTMPYGEFAGRVRQAKERIASYDATTKTPLLATTPELSPNSVEDLEYRLLERESCKLSRTPQLVYEQK